MNERGIWTTKAEFETHVFDESLCRAIIDIYSGNIADVGCGDGRYADYLNRNGFYCIGYDGSPLTKKPNIVKDFSTAQDIGKWDIVLSLEVGEHIPVEFEQVFIDNLCNATDNYIILSWAIPGQDGDGHVNCRMNEYIIGELWKRRFMYDENETRYLREKASVSWLKQTIMAFWKS